jgi:hypothetical protein
MSNDKKTQERPLIEEFQEYFLLIEGKDQIKHPDFTASNFLANLNKKDNLNLELKAFLCSTMDEVRAKKALDLGSAVMDTTDMEEINFLRDRLYKKEKGMHIAFPGQRDHSSHTLFNYLLGMYFEDRSTMLAVELGKQMKLRGLGDNFFEMWPFVSLLHDIGYILEGSNDALQPDGHNEFSRQGGRVVKEYFEYWFWYANGIHSKTGIAKVLEGTGIEPLNIENESLASLLYTLSDLGDLKDTFAEAIEKESPLPHHGDDRSSSQNSHFDCFSLWEAHFTTFFKGSGENSMLKRIEGLKKYTYESARNDTAYGVRLLDHGACSGMISLLTSTYYFRIVSALKKKKNIDLNKSQVDFLKSMMLSEELKEKWNQGIPDTFADDIFEAGLDESYWWAGIVWATASSALHNYLQDGKQDIQALRLEEDALTYLGILVDILQEWDRYKVYSNPSDSYNFVQGSEMKMWTEKKTNPGQKEEHSRVVLSYPTQKAQEKVTKALTESLADWEKIVDVQHHGPT